MSLATAIEEIGTGFIADCVDKVAPVAKDIEAFAMIEEAVNRFLRLLPARGDKSAELIAAESKLDALGVRIRAPDPFGGAAAKLRRQLELHRFAFTVPQPSELRAPMTAPAPTAALPPKNPGGKPRAAHWDQMWAAIAVELYVGNLQPATQADIERAMKGWLAEHDLHVSDSAVRDRARQLWRMLQQEDGR